MADIKSTARQFMEDVFNNHNLNAIDERLTANFVEHDEMPPGISNDRAGVKQFFGMMIEAFPDLKAELTHIVADGDTATVRAVMSGTHKGEFMGIPATGKNFSAATIDIVRFDGDKAAEHWGVMDLMALMQQLGVVPA